MRTRWRAPACRWSSRSTTRSRSSPSSTGGCASSWPTVADVGDTWEVVFVNDGSRTARSAMLRAAGGARAALQGASRSSRNFGHQIAITAGVDDADGEAVVVMDADLQDPPEVVLEMLARWREGFDVVYARAREARTARPVQARHRGALLPAAARACWASTSRSTPATSAS